MEPIVAENDETSTGPKIDALPSGEGRYLYCVAEAADGVSLGPIGLDGHEVYTVPFRDVAAVVHDCQGAPHPPNDEEALKRWVIAHHQVTEIAWEKWGSVLPLIFGTVIREEPGKEADQNLVGWLAAEYEALKRKLLRLRGRAEYGVQIFWEPKTIAQSMARTNPELRKLQDEIQSKPRGLAYLTRHRIETTIRHQMETTAGRCFRDFYALVGRHAEDVRVEKTAKSSPDLQMLMSLSCLLSKDEEAGLGEALDQINKMEGFMVRFTGPWPPYSFVQGTEPRHP